MATSRSSSDEQARTHARVFRNVLWRSRTSDLQSQVESLQLEVERRVETGLTNPQAFAQVYHEVRAQTINDLVQRVGRNSSRKIQNLLATYLPNDPILDGPDFHCDAGLGGLAKLLRAAGYDAAFWPGIDDDRLLDKSLGSAAILLTNDTLLMDRGVIKRGVIPALLVSITLRKSQQFAHVVDQLDLPLACPRCMACGGRLVAVEKESVRNRIPPRTYPWRDDYYVCDRCDKLFWEGTHWQKIRQHLADVAR